MTLISDKDYHSFFFSVHLTRSTSVCVYAREHCESFKMAWTNDCNVALWLRIQLYSMGAHAQHHNLYSLWLIYRHLICNLHGYLHYGICSFVCFPYAKNKEKCITVLSLILFDQAQLIRHTIYRLWNVHSENFPTRFDWWAQLHCIV